MLPRGSHRLAPRNQQPLAEPRSCERLTQAQIPRIRAEVPLGAVGYLTGFDVATTLTSVLISTLKNTMKLMNWSVTGLLLLLTAGQPAAEAAAAKTAKSTAASPAGKPARSKSIARDPWLGAIVLDAATGKVLFENLSREQLLAQAPELGAYLKTAVAGTPGARSDARVRVKMDASLGSFGGR